jgi:hypothetical protein
VLKGVLVQYSTSREECSIYPMHVVVIERTKRISSNP